MPCCSGLGPRGLLGDARRALAAAQLGATRPGSTPVAAHKTSRWYSRSALSLTTPAALPLAASMTTSVASSPTFWAHLLTPLDRSFAVHDEAGPRPCATRPWPRAGRARGAASRPSCATASVPDHCYNCCASRVASVACRQRCSKAMAFDLCWLPQQMRAASCERVTQRAASLEQRAASDSHSVSQSRRLDAKKRRHY